MPHFYPTNPIGNQISRTIAGTAYTQSFDYDNRLLGVAGGSVNGTFLYDADGNRVKGTVGGVTTVYLAGLYECQNGAVTKYYEGGALRRTGYASDNGVFYTLSDQLRSTSVLVNQNGTVNSRNFYYPYGGNRGGSAFSGITTKRFTGQYHEQGLPGGEGLAFYNARWYDAQVGVFISADTIVPSPMSPQSLNRYAYVSGNPLRYTDPTGHMQREDEGGGGDRSKPKPPTYGVWKPPVQKTWTWGTKVTATAKVSAPPPGRYWKTQNYGYLDSKHVDAGKPGRTLAQVKQGGAVEARQDLLGRRFVFTARYEVKPGLTQAEVEGVAMAIHQHFTTQFEDWEGRFPLWTGRNSSFAPEDNASHYVGMFAALRGVDPWTVVTTYLGSATGTDREPARRPYAESRNYDFTPRVQDAAGHWTNVPWPAAMMITPIGTESGLWEFVGAEGRGYGPKGILDWFTPK